MGWSKVGIEPWKPNGKGKSHGKPRSEIVAKYPYLDEDWRSGAVGQPDQDEQFLQQHPDGHGGWTWGGIQTEQKVPFKLPELIEAIALDKLIHICEGEKACLALIDKGHAATCSPGGAGKWPSHFSRLSARASFQEANDEPGLRHADKVEDNLKGVAADRPPASEKHRTAATCL